MHVVEGGHSGVETGLGGVIVADFPKDECAALKIGELALPLISVNAEFVKPMIGQALATCPDPRQFAGEKCIGKQAALDGEDFLGGNFLLTGELHLGLAGGDIERFRRGVGDEEIVDVFVEGIVL